MQSRLRLALVVSSMAVGAAGMCVPHPVRAADAQHAHREPVRVVYHFDNAATVDRGLRNVENHLHADRTVQVVVVANGTGIDFLLSDATDSKGELYELRILDLQQKGVKFEACENSLRGRNIGHEGLVPGVVVVAAGVEEIARLQFRLGYAYIKP